MVVIGHVHKHIATGLPKSEQLFSAIIESARLFENLESRFGRKIGARAKWQGPQRNVRCVARLKVGYSEKILPGGI